MGFEKTHWETEDPRLFKTFVDVLGQYPNVTDPMFGKNRKGDVSGE